MLEIDWKDVGWLTEAMEKQEPGRFWGSREQEGAGYLKYLTYRMYQGQPVPIAGSFGVRGPPLLEKRVEGQGT